ncbi:MAG: restriction endonuclease subunit S [Sulfuricella sp.]|nr:restriction endonuclease subunit S [Sulfuricella sp.]
MNSHLPADWAVARLGELATAIQYGYTEKAQQEKVGPRFLRITDIQDDKVDWSRVPFCVIDAKDKEKYLLRQGDLVFARTGATVGKSYLITGLIPESVFASYLIRVRLRPDIEPKYVSYFFRSSNYWQQISESQAGIGQPNVNGKKLAEIQIPVAPPDQQKRIVAEIEKQFSRLDEAVANLKRVKANLKRYKAAVLKAAVEGKLTEAWRKQHPDTQPASELLQRILAERRAKWEQAELAKMKAKGKPPKDDAWKKKYPEPAAPDTTNLPELPEGWVWATFEQLTSELMNGYGKRSQVEGQPQIVLRLADISDGEISYADVRRINCTVDETRKYVLAANDLLILRVNGSPELVGRFVLVRSTNEDALFCDHFIRVRCANPNLSVWLRLYADSERFRRYIDLNKVSSAGQNTINQGALLPFAVPLPPAMEQQNIVAEIDRRLSLADEAEAQVNANLQRAIAARVKIVVASVMQPTAEYRYQPNASL